MFSVFLTKELLLRRPCEVDLRLSLDLLRPGLIMAIILFLVFGEKVLFTVFAQLAMSSGVWALKTRLVGVRLRPLRGVRSRDGVLRLVGGFRRDSLRPDLMARTDACAGLVEVLDHAS